MEDETGRARQVARTNNAYKILIGKPEKKGSLTQETQTKERSVKMDVSWDCIAGGGISGLAELLSTSLESQCSILIYFSLQSVLGFCCIQFKVTWIETWMMSKFICQS